MPNNKLLKNRVYDLEERTAKFGEEVIDFARKLTVDIISRPIINQLIKAATSVGANYCEADDAESKKDFRHKIGICKKEARESKHFLRMVAKALPQRKKEALLLAQEAKEINLIFNAIFRKVS
jgi:four helix bundle protein